MITIELTNGRRYDNYPELGMNLETKDEIEECLNQDGIYSLCTETSGYVHISKDEVKTIY